MLDFNRQCLSASPLSASINELIERAAPTEQNVRQYLGVSSVGSECLRRVQYHWLVAPVHPVRTRDIFERGHFFEALTRKRMIAAGFSFAPDQRLAFAVVG